MKDLRSQYRLIDGIDRITPPPKPSLGLFHLGWSQSFRRQHGQIISFSDADDDISAIQILKIIRECTYSSYDLRTGSLFVPRGLELDPDGFYPPE